MKTAFCTLLYESDILVEQFLLIAVHSVRSLDDCCATYCRPDGIGTVLHEEWDSFLEVKDRLRRLVENQLTNFRFYLLYYRLFSYLLKKFILYNILPFTGFVVESCEE